MTTTKKWGSPDPQNRWEIYEKCQKKVFPTHKYTSEKMCQERNSRRCMNIEDAVNIAWGDV